MKKSIIFLISIIFIFFSSHIVKGLNGKKIIAVYSPDTNETTIKELKMMGINTVFIKPNINHIKTFNYNRFNVFVSIPVFYNSVLLNSHPELNAIDKNGYRLPKISWYKGISPTVDWYRQHILRNIKNIIERFPVKGIFLDFIRYPLHWEEKEKVFIDSCYSDNSIKKFEQFAKIKVPENLRSTSKKSHWIINNYYQKWVLFKNHIITSFVSEVRIMIKQINQDIKLGVFVIPWKESEYQGAIKNIAAQDVKSLSLLVDFISPMMYHKMLGNNREWIVQLIDYFNSIASGKILPVIQAFNLNPNEFLETLRIANTHPVLKGFTVFAYNHLDQDKKKVLYSYMGKER